MNIAIDDVILKIAAGLSGLFWFFFILISNIAFRAPYIVYKRQRRQLTKYTPDDIDIKPHYPSFRSVEKTELVIKNGKDVAIENCRCSLASLQIDRTSPDYLGLLKDLPWVIESKLVEENITIPAGGNGYVAVEAWDRPISGTMLHVPNPNGVDYGPSVGIEFCGKYGLAIYRDRYYKAGFCIIGTIDGVEVKDFEYFELKYDGSSLKLKRVKK